VWRLELLRPAQGKAQVLQSDSLVKDIFLKLGREASELAKHAKKKTITSHEVEFATRLVLPGELAKHAIIEANKAKFKYGATSRN